MARTGSGPWRTRVTWSRASRVGPALAVAVMAAGCASRPMPDPDFVQRECEFRVINATPTAIEVRLITTGYSTRWIGSLNYGELLTHRVPCAARRVYVMGVEIPWQSGAPRQFGAVYGDAELVEGEVVRIALHWP
jgi:hypothetical protein